uniref:Uncharacterized protein n=1 Tax=Phaeomonas parva TaxID=124430 RepID=A0A6U4DEC5_9STRA|mmetsp:Transcript_1688/g.4720  ORF Transcript_1688/g.4720 Transcript_1688/m.4720 type:complete len:113 (+) Transcript_1688:570-908(+)
MVCGRWRSEKVSKGYFNAASAVHVETHLGLAKRLDDAARGREAVHVRVHLRSGEGGSRYVRTCEDGRCYYVSMYTYINVQRINVAWLRTFMKSSSAPSSSFFSPVVRQHVRV